MDRTKLLQYPLSCRSIVVLGLHDKFLCDEMTFVMQYLRATINTFAMHMQHWRAKVQRLESVLAKEKVYHTEKSRRGLMVICISKK